MPKKTFLLISAAALTFFISCSSTPDIKNAGIQKVAIVQITVNNSAGNIMRGFENRIDPALIKASLPEVLKVTEKTFGSYWKVVPVSSFISSSAYKGQSIDKIYPPEYYTPQAGGKTMLNFTSHPNPREQIDPARIIALASAVGADAVVLIYTEWGTETGKYTTTKKPLASNCIAMYDGKSGNRFFYNVTRAMSPKVVGGFGVKVVDQSSIGEWVAAYEQALTLLLNKLNK